MIQRSALSALFAITAALDGPATVREVLLKNVAAFERGDFNTIDHLWAHGEEVSVFESGYANYGRADYRDHHLKPELTEMKNVRYRLDNIKPRVSGSLA